MMGPAGITVALAVCWLTGVVGAASLPPGDQYSPHQSPYWKDVAQGPLGYPNWLKYQQDLTTRLEPPDYTYGTRRLDVNYISREPMVRKDSVIRDLDISPLAPGGWRTTGSADVMRNSSRPANLNIGVSEDSEIASVSSDDDFVREDTFQDQGPGSVEVYKLDLRRENSLLVPRTHERQSVAGSRMKSKIPKKATAEEILWKVKSIETSKIPLPSIFQQPPRPHKDSKLPREFSSKVKENHKDEVFTVGGVPELQVGCEGLEASERQKRSSVPGAKKTYEDDWDNSHKYQDPVYIESTEPILLRVTPIVLDIEEEEPPSGEIYEEMDELLKLKKLESTSPKPATRRWNRADIDPALEADKHQKERMRVETFPERGDLGPKSNGSSSSSSSSQVKGSIAREDLKQLRLEKGRFRRDTVVVNSAASFEIDPKGHKHVPSSALSRSASLSHQGGRRLLWVQYPERQENHENQVTRMRHHQVANEHREDRDLWGFGEDDGEISDSEGDSEMDKLRQAEVEKRRRENERRRKEELHRRRGHQPHTEDRASGSRDVSAEVERIRAEHEKQLEKEQRERQRMAEERRGRGQKLDGENDQRKIEETRRRQEEESRRRLEEEQRRNRYPSHSRQQQQQQQQEEERWRDWNIRREEEERRRRLEDQRNHESPPSPLTRPESPRAGNTPGSQQEKEDEERKLRDYIERNRPIDPKKTGDHRRPDEQSRKNESDERSRFIEEQRKRRIEEERRRQRMEEHRRRQQHPDTRERQHQMEEHRRRQHQPDEEERRRQMEEQRRRDHSESRAIQEERRRRLEEERKLQEYVRRNQPVIVPTRNNSRASNSSQEGDLQEQRRTIEAARQWERNRQPIAGTNNGRIHGPSAPTYIGQRNSQYDPEEARRRQERLEEERLRESNRRVYEEEERRREAEYQRAESRRHEEERKRLEATMRRDEENRRKQLAERRNSWEDSGSSRRPSTAPRRNDPPGETRDSEAEELRRREAAGRITDTVIRNREDEWWRRSKEHERQRKQQEERERQRLENERNSRNNGRRRPQHEDSRPKPRQRGESVRSGNNDIEWRRREHARLNSLPVSARIILRPEDASQNGGGASSRGTSAPPFVPSFGSRSSFDNDIDFPALTPNRQGLEAPRFPAPATTRPPVKSPGACVWAIVQCCPANNRLTSCFESMGCPGANWDPNPCRGSLADAARAEVVRFYEAAEEENTRF